MPQVATSTTTSVAIAAKAYRRPVTIKNIDATIVVYVECASTTATDSGIPLAAGESIRFHTDKAISAIAASGTPTLAYTEE